jgi:hypothetical protein
MGSNCITFMPNFTKIGHHLVEKLKQDTQHRQTEKVIQGHIFSFFLRKESTIKMAKFQPLLSVWHLHVGLMHSVTATDTKHHDAVGSTSESCVGGFGFESRCRDYLPWWVLVVSFFYRQTAVVPLQNRPHFIISLLSFFLKHRSGLRPPLWSSSQSSWLQIQRSQVRFPALPDFLRCSGAGTGSTQPREDNWGATWMKK